MLSAGKRESASTTPADVRAKVRNALLSMQRYSWEQGVAAQAFLESGDTEMVVLFAKEAVSRQLADGRTAVIGGLSAVTDPAAIGEALLAAARTASDSSLKEAADRLLDWLLNKAPRNRDGVLYHLHDRPQVWVDSFYMSPPFLSAAGFHAEAFQQLTGLRTILLDPETKLFSHMWDDGLRAFARKAHWGVGNGWALSGMTRVIRTLPAGMPRERQTLIGWVREGVEACLPYMTNDGRFHDVIDDSSTFVETNLSQMLSYVLFRGMAGGWLAKSFRDAAEAMRKAAHARVDGFGLVQGVCGSPHFDRPGTAAEGQAFFLLMEAAADDFTRA
jgi:unsaturated rhamnogalacturonyl hydrolase